MKSRRNSRIYLVAAFAAITFSLAVRAQAQVESVLYTFPFGGASGSSSLAPPILDRAGDLYGISPVFGGANKSCGNAGCGMVYEMVRETGGAWSNKVLHTFTGRTDGGVPVGPLIFDGAGNLYGTTEYAGDTNGCKDVGYTQYGCGVVFELSPNGATWKETVLYTFSGGADGGKPYGGLARDSAGNLYGTTLNGGDLSGVGCVFSVGCGVVFKLSPSSTGWTETVLHIFETNSIDGFWPYSTPVLDAAGNVYGTTVYGGNSVNQQGTVFELTSANGYAETILYNFTGGTDGSTPNGNLILDSSGNIFGSTQLGGNQTLCPSGCGVVFELSPGSSGWTQTVLSTAAPWDGMDIDGITRDTAGNLYFSAIGGGNNPSCPESDNFGCGTVTKLTAANGYRATVLTRFPGYNNGLAPSVVALDAAGNIFGSAGAGSTDYGIIFEIRQQ